MIESVLIGLLLFSVAAMVAMICPEVWHCVPWHLKHKFLGWHYVLYKDSATQFYARVIKLPNGDLMMLGGWCREHYDAKIVDGRLQDSGATIHPITF